MRFVASTSFCGRAFKSAARVSGSALYAAWMSDSMSRSTALSLSRRGASCPKLCSSSSSLRNDTPRWSCSSVGWRRYRCVSRYNCEAKDFSQIKHLTCMSSSSSVSSDSSSCAR
eukprot:scaffold13562_cov63-Phaeocystis_antarctica.AAC.4